MRVSVFVIAVLIASACTAQTESSTTTVLPQPTMPEAVVAEWLPTMAETQNTSMAALVHGELHIDVDAQCVTVETDYNTLLVVFWPGTFLDITDPAAPVLVRANHVRHQDGDRVELGGGSTSYDDLVSMIDNSEHFVGTELAASCVTDDVWIAAPDF